MSSTCVNKNSKEFCELQKEFNISKSSLENILKGWLKDHHKIDYESEEFKSYLEDKLCQTRSIYTSESKYNKAHRAWEMYTEKYKSFGKDLIKTVRQIMESSFASNDFIIYETDKAGEYTLRIKEPMYNQVSKKEVTPKEEKTNNPFKWARTAENNYEVSTRGGREGKRFSALIATFKPGTIVDGVDVGGKTIEYVYQTVIKKSRKGQAPSKNSRLNLNPTSTSEEKRLKFLEEVKAKYGNPLTYSTDEGIITVNFENGSLRVIPFAGSIEDLSGESLGNKDINYFIGALKAVEDLAGGYEDFSYYGAYLPLWQKWAKQNPELIEELRIRAAGKTLTDQFAGTKERPGRVSQARALADILNSTTSTSNRVEIYKGNWTREEVAKQTDKVFLFGDNTYDRAITHHVPTSTQAVIRGLPNAIGIDTKKNRGTDETISSTKSIPSNAKEKEISGVTYKYTIEEPDYMSDRYSGDRIITLYKEENGIVLTTNFYNRRWEEIKKILDLNRASWSPMKTITKQGSYFTDEDFGIFKEQVDKAIQKAIDSGKTIVIPEGGIGTGKAQLEQRAPKLFSYLQDKLNSLRETVELRSSSSNTSKEFD